MKIYIDEEYKCHAAPDDGLTEVQTGFFDGKAPGYIEGYRFIPDGKSWTTEDGTVFSGEMIAPWQPWETLDKIQRAYEQEQVAVLSNQNEELLDAMAAMVEDVYNQDMSEIGEE